MLAREFEGPGDRSAVLKSEQGFHMLRVVAAVAVFATAAVLVSGPAPAQVLKSEPAVGNLAAGKKALVDDGTCPAGQIKQVTGGSKTDHIARSSICVPKGPKK